MSFLEIKTAVKTLFEENKHRHLFTTGIEKGLLNQAYLDTFIDPVDRQGHNCNCCRSFLNQFGDIVWIEDGQVKTLWDFELPEGSLYAKVPSTLRQIVLSKPIQEVFFHSEANLGTDHNFGKLGEKWTHFHISLPSSKVTSSVGTKAGLAKSAKDVLYRSLVELRIGDVEQVLELIEANTLYRGVEAKPNLQKLKQLMLDSAGNDLELFAWENHHNPAAKLRNTAVGQLLIDLAEGRPLEAAVTSYERITAPTNYRRPTALVTPAMLDRAKKELEELGLLSALDRRLATPDDIPLAEAIWVNRPVPGAADLFESLKSDLPFDVPANIREVDYATLMDMLKASNKLEVLFEKRLLANFVNLTTADNNILAWDNPVAWAYHGGVADSIKERVKAAGGKVDGDVRISLSWFNHDDLDLSVVEPGGKDIYFSEKFSHETGGRLDVDMNAGCGTTRKPVENIAYPDRRRMPNGIYQVWVHNYRKRESIDYGFSLEIEIDNVIHTLEFNQAVHDNKRIAVANLRVVGGVITVEPLIPINTGKNMQVETLCGMKTRTFQPVSMVVPSPNHWSGQSKGNKHTFFILPDAVSDDPVRGFFNEFIRPDLNDHRKTMELIGGKTTIKSTTPQVAGLGFSETLRNHVIVKIDAGIFKVNF